MPLSPGQLAWILLDGVEFPELLAGGGFDAEDLALRRQFAGGGPEGQDVTRHDRRRGEVAAVAIGEVGELHLPLFLAGLLVKRDAAPVNGADEDHAVADGNAAAIGREQNLLVDWIELRLVTPERLAGFCI